MPPSLQAEENEVVEPNNDELGSKMAGNEQDVELKFDEAQGEDAE